MKILLAKENILMANKPMKKCSIFLAIRQIQCKTKDTTVYKYINICNIFIN